ncbi:MAG: glycosyltransferase family 4 protein [Leptolyngbyaceae cyanobacterium bins.349]|nr:glycosyltransferase family 4 protein [Leptolyngbyaceae cyanobacterium bins.349]
MAKNLKILYVAGPGNVIQTFNHWRQGEDDPSQVSMTFSGQFYDVCQALEADGYIIASHNEKQRLQDGAFTLEHRPVPLRQRQGALAYYVGQILYTLGIVASALKFRANAVVAGDLECYFLLSLLPKLGIQVIPSLHCVLWTKYGPLSRVKQWIYQANGYFFAHDCFAILSTSEDVSEQVRQITPHQGAKLVNFLSTYRRSEFAHIQPPDLNSPVFRVLFAGRIVPEKGVFDLLEIAKRFQAEGIQTIEFDVCGTGPALEALRQQIEAAGLQQTVHLHGYCDKPKMRQMFSQSHAVIVPTRSDFVEGLNQVVIEGVLANRPVITSSICPAIAYVEAAVVEVPPNDVAAYGDAILELQTNRAFYVEKQTSCKLLQEQFYNPATGWGEALKGVLCALPEASLPSPVYSTTSLQREVGRG